MSATRSTASWSNEDRTAKSSSSRAMSFNGSMGKIEGSFALDLPRFERGRKPSSWGSLIRETLDLGPALAELVLDPLEAAVEVVDRKSTRLELQSLRHLVCRLLL